MTPSTTPTSLPKADHNRAPGFIACVTITSAVALILVSLRMYVRLRIVHKFGVDDATILLAMICCIGALCINGMQVSQGFGQHVFHLTSQEQFEEKKLRFILEIFILVGSAISKISVSLLLLRLLGNAAGHIRRYFLNGINVFVGVYTVIDFIDIFISCYPTRKLWEQKLPGDCRSGKSVNAVSYFQAACSAAVALILSSLPVVFFRNLQLNPRTKVVTCLLMSLGVFDGMCSIIRSTVLANDLISVDFTYAAIPVTIWGSLELNFAIIAACIPTVRPLFRFLDDTKVGPSHSSRRGFLKQNETAQDRAYRSNQTRGASTPYSLTTFEPSHSDGRSERSTQPPRESDGIRKTTEIDIEAEAHR